MNKLGIITKEVYRKNIKSWSFFWMVASPIITFGIILLIIHFIGQDRQASSVGEIAVVGANQEIQQLIDSSESGNTIHYDFSEEQAREKLQAGNIEGYLLIDQNQLDQIKYYRKATSKDISLDAYQALLSNFVMIQKGQEIGIAQDELAALQATNVKIDKINISVDEDGQVSEVSTSDPRQMARVAIAYIVSFVVFLFIMNYVGIISQEVATEKGSRIMEIILSSVSATTHFIGKILGIGLVILTQLIIYGILYFLIKLIVDQFNILLEFEGLNIGSLIAESGNVVYMGVLYAVLGIIIYTALGGFLGSLVSKTEDVNKTITPIVFLAIGGFYVGMYALNSPNSPLVRIFSQIPFFTPFVMPFRIAAETVSHQELIISVVITIIFTLLVVWFSLVFYKSNVLVYSDKGIWNTFKRSFQLWKSERASR